MTPDEIRQKAESDLEFFIGLIAPTQVLGNCHRDVIHWWNRGEAKAHQLLLFPRDHGKSRLVAYRVAWYLAKDPTLRVLYISATSNLAEKQLTFIKGILTSDIFRRYWPDHTHPEEGKRAKWTNSEIALDHPQRTKENIRDASVFTAGLTTSITGLHCDIAVLDDVVVNENAYTDEGRRKVQSQYSLLSSIEGADAQEWVVGTRYHPKDLYNDMMGMVEDIYDDEDKKQTEDHIYETYERAVEDLGDGTGEFLWPRQQRKDGKWFGFDKRILASKRGKYLDRLQFRAQYYNDPTDPDNKPIDYDQFNYFDRKHLKQEDGINWFYHGKRLNLVASVDFAFSTRKGADYTALVVIGVDEDNNIYVLDIDRFQTDKISEYFKNILGLYNRWGFKRLVAETTVAQQSIVRSLKEDWFAAHGLNIRVIEVKPTRNQGSKEERMEAILMPRYENNQVFHYRGGNTQTLEDELVTQNPPHDDVKDALANAIENAVKPASNVHYKKHNDNIVWHSRFGGRSH
jgi:predicted phage terminase large subunit-like protein